MMMSKAEIAKSYREAINQKAQIKILSELNGCSQDEIKDILEAEGFNVRRTKKTTKAAEPPQKKPLHDAVRRAVEKEMIEVQETLDKLEGEVKLQKDKYEIALHEFKSKEEELIALSEYLRGETA